MPTELPKSYNPAFIEPEANRVWMEEKLFHADPSAPGEPYSIVIPPPNVTGALHLGHAINTTLQDVLIRVHRMRGFNVVWIPGIDHAGIATQAVVEKQLKEKENKTRHDVGREALVERIWTWKQQYGDRILEQLKRLGCSCDWDRARFTLDDMCARAVRETFFKLFKDGLIYRGKRLVNWDTFLQTSISDDEIYHETVKTSLWHIRYPIEDASLPPLPPGEGRGEGELRRTSSQLKSSDNRPHPNPLSKGEGTEDARPIHMIVATTRPETMLGDTAVAVHSQDPRWNWAIGKFVRLPLTGRLIPIIADDILVDPKFGTGVVKVTPAHDPNDYAVWQRHKGQPDEIDLINILSPDGRLVDDARWKPYAGMKRDAARLKVVEDLKTAGLLEKEEPYETQVGHSDRSKTPIEPYLSDQWFVKMAPLAEPALEVVREGIIQFYPSRFASTFLDWLGEKRDWPISRQLWWGHRIPVWNLYLHGESGGGSIIQQLMEYFAEIGASDDVLVLPSAESGDWIQICTRTARADRALEAMNVFYRVTGAPKLNRKDFADVVVSEKAWQIVRSIMDGPAADPVERDPDVLDTWFSSALWPHSTLGWPENTPDLQKWYPTSVLVTSRDIITLWVARMVMTGIYNMGERTRSADVAQPPSAVFDRRSKALKEELPPDGGTQPRAAVPHMAEHNRGRLSNADAKALGIPFRDVHIHATILDGKGERMSKSKGNGVDPVDIIDTHGADALRFTLTQMATETQDVRLPVKKDSQGRNTSDKFDVGKHFCNKIWQVSLHFVMANLEKTAPQEVDERQWALADRWIVSRFNRTLEIANSALETYRFDQYAKACYDFFWGDFCDWYVEASKPALRDPARASQTANILAAVLDAALRLMHPMIPFTTEVLWWELNRVRPKRGLPARIECFPSERLIKASWPKTGDFDPEAEGWFPKVQEIVTTIRNIRNQYNVSPKQPVPVSIAAPGDASTSLRGNRELIELLASCTIKNVQPVLGEIKNAFHTTAAGCELYVENLVDPEAEKKVNAKRCEDLKKQIAAMRGRLSNEAYTSKAPAHLVQQTKDQLAEAEGEAAKLGCEA